MELNISRQVILLTLLLLLTTPQRSHSGCCNDNYWCDGDPSFKRAPSASQGPQEPYVLIRWSSSNLNLAKCVDYFYIEYFEGGRTGIRRVSPVNVEVNKSLDDWKAAMDDLEINYIANISVQENQHYIFNVFAIDKGAGWGELEGTARVSSGPIEFKTRAHEPLRTWKARPHSSALTRSIYNWALVNFKKRLWRSKKGYDFLPDIWIRNGDRVQRYEDGQLFGMRKPTFEVSEAIEIMDDIDLLYVNITLHLSHLRTSYVWRSFFTVGVVNLYHTCGNKLPHGSFLESRPLPEVKSFLQSSNCSFLPVTVALQVHRNITRIPHSGIDDWDGYRVLGYHLNLSMKDFEFDVPWLFSHFHNLSSLWKQQKVILGNQILKNLEKVF